MRNIDSYYFNYRHLFPGDLNGLKDKWNRVQALIASQSDYSSIAQNERISVCLLPGTYASTIHVALKDRLELRGLTCSATPNKRPSVTVANAGYTTRFLAGKLRKAAPSAITVMHSKNVIVRNINFKNSKTDTSQYYVDEKGHRYPYKFSVALWAGGSKNVQFVDTIMESRGKNTLTSYGGDVRFTRAKLSCFYFCASVSNATLFADNSSFNINHLEDSSDLHSAFWMDHSNFYFNSTQINMQTGVAIFSGNNTATPNEDFTVVMDGKTTISGNTPGMKMKGANFWTIDSSDGGGINVYLYDRFPTNLKDRWYNTWVKVGTGGKSYPASRVFKYPKHTLSETRPALLDEYTRQFPKFD